MSKAQERYDWYKSHGICVWCGQQPVYKNYVHCLECRMKSRENSQHYRDTHKDECNAKSRIYMEKRRSRLRADGICISCGKRKSQKGELCGICRAKKRKNDTERKRKNGSVPQEILGNGVYCVTCARPICNGTKLCDECYQRQCAILEKARAARDMKINYWKISNKKFYGG